eukprot:351883-Chlamydomonas_euryale.AAC.2
MQARFRSSSAAGKEHRHTRGLCCASRGYCRLSRRRQLLQAVTPEAAAAGCHAVGGPYPHQTSMPDRQHLQVQRINELLLRAERRERVKAVGEDALDDEAFGGAAGGQSGGRGARREGDQVRGAPGRRVSGGEADQAGGTSGRRKIEQEGDQAEGK